MCCVPNCHHTVRTQSRYYTEYLHIRTSPARHTSAAMPGAPADCPRGSADCPSPPRHRTSLYHAAAVAARSSAWARPCPPMSIPVSSLPRKSLLFVVLYLLLYNGKSKSSFLVGCSLYMDKIKRLPRYFVLFLMGQPYDTIHCMCNTVKLKPRIQS